MRWKTARLYASIAIIVGSATSAGAQGHQHVEGPPLTLRAALDEALAKNPDLAALRAQVDATRLKPMEEHYLAAPMLEAQVWQWPINSINPANTNMYMFTLGQDLPGRGKRQLRTTVAEKDVALVESDVAIRARDVLNQVKQSYASLFIARKAADIHLQNIDLLRQIADVSQAKYTTGKTSQQDVLKPVVELSKHHNDIIMFEEQANVAAARLNALLDRAPDAAIGPLVEPHEQTLIPATADLQRLAIDRQPELRRARAEIEHAEAELRLGRADYKPDFTVQGGYMIVPHQSDAVLAMVGVTWPKAPWAHGRVDAHVAVQTAAVEAAKARERAVENGVRLAVQEAYVHVKSAQDRAELLRTTLVPQARQTFDVSRVAYQADKIDFQAVIENERTLLDSELDYFRALSDFEQAIAELERAVGTDLPVNMTVSVPSVEVK
jgi:outer membrane protein TolC